MRPLGLPLLAFLVAAPAWAGPHLRWDAPFGHPDAQTNKNFACDTNTGENVLVVSFWAPDSVENVVEYLAVIDGQSATPSLPDWWRIGSCRPATSLAFDAATAPDWQVGTLPGATIPGIDYAQGFSGPNRFRLRVIVLADTLQPLRSFGPRSGEQFVCRFLFRRQRTVPSGVTPACAGCNVSMCLSHARIYVFGEGADGSNTSVSWEGFASIDQQHWVTWQGGGPHPCPAAVPVTPSSWGRIKSIYR